MKKIYLWLLLITTLHFSFSQISIIEGFEATTTPTGWTYTSFSRTTTTPCVGTASLRRNFYSFAVSGSVVSPNQIAASNGEAVTYSFDWKSIEYNTGDGVDGTVDVQYSVDDGTNWVTLGTITANSITNCGTWTQTIPAGTIPNGSDFKIRFLGTWISGDYYFYIDNVSVTQPTTAVPNCTSLSTPADNATDVSITGILSWTAATGAPTGYKLKVGTTSGGTDVINDLDVGNVTSYDIPGFLNGNTTYYVTVTPYNANGSSSSCTETSFTTQNVPVGAGCLDPIVVTSLPYTTTDDTANYLDLIDGIAGTTGCGSTNSYLNGNDVFYSYTAAATGSIHVKLTPTNTYSGIFVYDTCANVGLSCIAGMANSGTTIREFDLPVTAGQTYIFVISTWAAPQTTPYTFEITLNSTNSMDWNNIQWITDGVNGSNSSLTVPGNTPITAYTQGYEAGVTNAAGQGTDVVAWIGYSSTNTNPNTWPESAWRVATYVDEQGNNDNFSANFDAPVGTNYVASRWRIGTGPYTYGGYNGPWDGTNNNSIIIIGNTLANDECSGAIALTAGGVFADQAITTSNAGATLSTDTPTPTCGTSGFSTSGKDVWYTVTVPASGNITIETQTNSGLLDTVFQVYSGTCGSLTTVGCSDDDGVDAFSLLSLTGQTPGAVLLVRVYGYNGASGSFKLSAYDASLGIDDINNSLNLITIYPNPVKEVLYFNSEEQVVSTQVFDLSGKLVLENNNITTNQVNVSALREGTYILKATLANGKVETEKFLKK